MIIQRNTTKAVWNLIQKEGGVRLALNEYIGIDLQLDIKKPASKKINEIYTKNTRIGYDPDTLVPVVKASPDHRNVNILIATTDINPGDRIINITTENGYLLDRHFDRDAYSIIVSSRPSEQSITVVHIQKPDGTYDTHTYRLEKNGQLVFKQGEVKEKHSVRKRIPSPFKPFLPTRKMLVHRSVLEEAKAKYGDRHEYIVYSNLRNLISAADKLVDGGTRIITLYSGIAGEPKPEQKEIAESIAYFANTLATRFKMVHVMDTTGRIKRYTSKEEPTLPKTVQAKIDAKKKAEAAKKRNRKPFNKQAGSFKPRSGANTAQKKPYRGKNTPTLAR